MIALKFLRRFWRRPVETLPKNQENTGTFFNMPNGSSVCFFCHEFLPPLPQDKKLAAQLSHKNSDEHKKMISTVNSNGICVVHTPNDYLIFCKICKGQLRYKQNIKGHIMASSHKLWFKQMQDLTIYATELLTTNSISFKKFLKSESNFAFCKACNTEVECTSTKIEQHTVSNEHRNELLKALLPCTGLFPIEDKKKMWCKICETRYDNNVDVLLQHLTENMHHGYWFYDVNMMTKQDVSVKEFLTDEKELMAMCHRCDLKIKADLRSIEAHVQSEPHRFRHKTSALGEVKSLALQNFWPAWCHWNYFGHPSLNWPA